MAGESGATPLAKRDCVLFEFASKSRLRCAESSLAVVAILHWRCGGNVLF